MEQKDYRLAAIMYTDIVGFSRMMERDEAGTLKILSFHNALVTDIVTRHHGTVIKTIGDAFLIDFKNTVEALQSALEIQDKIHEYNKEHSVLPLLLRIGIHLGDIYFFENDALGEGINIAARLQALAHPGCICFSQDVYNQVLNKIDFTAVKLGKVSLKNITKEIHAYEITSLNVEFDPNRDKPRPGYTPGAYLQPDATAAEAAPQPGPGQGADRSYTKEGSATVIADIRAAIMADIKRAGRRLTVEEALRSYGEYGVEASEVIAAMADQGLLLKRRASERSEPERERENSGMARDIGDAVEGIVGAIERGIKNWDSDGHQNRMEHRMDHRMREKMVRMTAKIEHAAAKMDRKRDYTELETGKWDKKLGASDYYKHAKEERSASFDEYRTAVSDNARKVRTGLVGNLVSFIGVNGLLWYINLFVSGGDTLWAAIVSAAWGVGVVSNLVASARSSAKEREVERLPDLTSGQLGIYKKINRIRDSLAQHSATALTVPAMMLTINLATSPDFLWALIPTPFIVLSWISHIITYPFTKRRLEKQFFQSIGHEGGWGSLLRARRRRKEDQATMGPYARHYEEAYAAKDAILAQERRMGKDSPVGEGMSAQLDEYVEQVRLLSVSANEIDGIIQAIPMNDLARDKATLVSKLGQAGSESLEREYRKSIAEIEKQELASKDLNEQREVLGLRLTSSVNALKQMQLDLARLRTMPEAGGQIAIDTVKRRTDELQHYLEDMRRGYDDVHADPYKELERIVEEREKAERLPPPKHDPS